MGDNEFDNLCVTTMAGDGPCRKRLKKEGENGESSGEKPVEEGNQKVPVSHLFKIF